MEHVEELIEVYQREDAHDGRACQKDDGAGCENGSDPAFAELPPDIDKQQQGDDAGADQSAFGRGDYGVHIVKMRDGVRRERVFVIAAVHDFNLTGGSIGSSLFVVDFLDNLHDGGNVVVVDGVIARNQAGASKLIGGEDGCAAVTAVLLA